MSDINIPITPLTHMRLPTELQGPKVYLDEKLGQVLSGDIEVTIGKNTILADVSNAGRADLLLMQNQIDNGATSVTWYQSTGSVILTPAQFKTVVDAVSNYVTLAMSAWQTASDGIKAGTITTIAQIQSIQWPSRLY